MNATAATGIAIHNAGIDGFLSPLLLPPVVGGFDDAPDGGYVGGLVGEAVGVCATATEASSSAAAATCALPWEEEDDETRSERFGKNENSVPAPAPAVLRLLSLRGASRVLCTFAYAHNYADNNRNYKGNATPPPPHTHACARTLHNDQFNETGVACVASYHVRWLAHPTFAC